MFKSYFSATGLAPDSAQVQQKVYGIAFFIFVGLNA